MKGFLQSKAAGWYFSLAEGQPSYVESESVTVPLVEGVITTGTTYSLYMDGTLIGQL